MPGAEIRRFSDDRRGLAMNGVMSVAGGALSALAETLLLPIIVLAFFVGQLTTSWVPIGFVPAIGIGLWAVGRLPAALFLGGQRRQQPWVAGASIVKAVATGLLSLTCFRIGPAAVADTSGPLLRSFFICWVAYSLAGGFASVPQSSLLAKSVPDARRATYYRQRGFWGGVAGLLAGLFVAQILRDGGPAFPRNFGLIFLAATICQLAAVFFQMTLQEPSRVAVSPTPGPLEVLRGVPAAFTDPHFRRYLAYRVLVGAAAIIDPFLVIFALARLGIDQAAIGGYVVAYVVGRMLAVPLWAGIERTYGDKPILQLSALLRLVPPMLALVLPYLLDYQELEQRLAAGNQLPIVFGVAFLILGAVTSGQGRANFAYLSEIANPRLHGVYAGIANAVLAVVAFAPVLGGMLIERSGYEVLFLVGAAIALLAVFASGALTDAFVRPVATPSIARVRRGSGNARPAG